MEGDRQIGGNAAEKTAREKGRGHRQGGGGAGDEGGPQGRRQT